MNPVNPAFSYEYRAPVGRPGYGPKNSDLKFLWLVERGFTSENAVDTQIYRFFRKIVNAAAPILF